MCSFIENSAFNPTSAIMPVVSTSAENSAIFRLQNHADFLAFGHSLMYSKAPLSCNFNSSPLKSKKG
eukprot:IDg5187t1